MYKTLWNFISKHVKKSHITPAFLTTLTVAWTAVGLLFGSAGILIAGNTTFMEKITILFCTGGYAGLIPGFLCGIFFLYKISFRRDPHPALKPIHSSFH